jgi:hypothetical protein
MHKRTKNLGKGLGKFEQDRYTTEAEGHRERAHHGALSSLAEAYWAPIVARQM